MRALPALVCLTFLACGGNEVDTLDPGPDPAPECALIAEAPTDREAFDHALTCLTDPGTADRDFYVRGAMADLRDVVNARGGFPIVDGDQVTFAYFDDPDWDEEDDRRTGENYDPTRRKAPIRLTGEFNDWNEDNGPELTAVPGGLFHLTVPLAEVAGRGYRFVARDNAGSAIVFSDPQSRRYDFARGGRRSLISGDETSGHLEQLGPLPAAMLGRPRKVDVWVPPGYDQGTARYPVLYMHDGNNLFDTNQHRSSQGGTWDADGVMEDQLSDGHVRPGIIVGVPNSMARVDEYTHAPDERGGGPTGGDADAYLDLLVNEVKPAIDARYRTRPEREHTGVMGSSLGGLVSFYAGLRFPEVFGFVGGMSSTFIWGRIGVDGPSMLDLYREAGDLSARGQVFYLDAGGGPAPTCPAGEDNYCELLEMRDILRAGGVDTEAPDIDASPLPADVDLMWVWDEGAAHNEANWRIRLHRPLRLFLRPGG